MESEVCVDVPSTTCESKPVDACTSIELELCKDVSTLFMKIMLVEEEENENDEFNVCLYEFEWDKYQWKTKSQVPEEQCRLEEKEVCFHPFHPHDHQCHKSCYQNPLLDHATHHSQVCEPAYEPAPAPKALYDAPY